MTVTPPRLEGTVAVAPRRRLGFAEFGPPDGRAVVWLHGEHMVGLLPDAELHVLAGESHLGGLGAGGHILTTLVDLWDARSS